VFEDGAIQNPNGSLWTLPYEVFCYVLAALAALFGPKGMRWAMAALAVFVVAALFGPLAGGSLRLTTLLDHKWLALFGGAFFLGAWLNGASQRILAGLAAAAVIALVFTKGAPTAAALAGVFLYGSLAIWAGQRLNLDRIVTRGRDISYGVYIYAFPCQQLAVRALPPHDAPSYAAYYSLALAATLGFAWLSWVWIEKPALTVKARLTSLIERGVGRLRLPALGPAGQRS